MKTKINFKKHFLTVFDEEYITETFSTFKCPNHSTMEIFLKNPSVTYEHSLRLLGSLGHSNERLRTSYIWSQK